MWSCQQVSTLSHGHLVPRASGDAEARQDTVEQTVGGGSRLRGTAARLAQERAGVDADVIEALGRPRDPVRQDVWRDLRMELHAKVATVLIGLDAGRRVGQDLRPGGRREGVEMPFEPWTRRDVVFGVAVDGEPANLRPGGEPH